jgi:hypothetical protein
MIAVIICIILLVIVIWIHNRTEPFEGLVKNPVPTINKELAENYHKFATEIYNPFMTIWKKSIISLMSAETAEPAPLSSPSAAASLQAPPVPSDADLNEFITNLSQKQGNPLPQITQLLPETIDLATFSSIAPIIPADPAPYRHALNWMNKKMEDAHAQLQAALKGESFMNLEGFDNQTCQDLSQCFRDNPALIKQCGIAMQEQGKKDQSEINRMIKRFLIDQDLKQSMNTTARLVTESKKIQDQAQSGDLINQLNLPEEPEAGYTLPEGSDKLSKMTPEQRKGVQEASPAMYSYKGLLDQINRNLR